jgi:hypothetical protein
MYIIDTDKRSPHTGARSVALPFGIFHLLFGPYGWLGSSSRYGRNGPQWHPGNAGLNGNSGAKCRR